MNITRKRLTSKCGLGNGRQCCSYLGIGSKGFVCLKHSKFRKEIDLRRDAGEMIAMGDNCSGLKKVLN
ncbi:MAG: hypothetical protein WC516_08990 [Patescibacteria group bacterium]